jgi:hypothetical protein
MGGGVHSCGLGLEELSRGVGTGGILVVECKCWNVGGLLQICGLWFFGRVPKLGSGISLSGELVPEFNYFKKFQVFKILNPFGLVLVKVVPQNEIW